MQGEPVTEFTSQEHFKYIGCNIECHTNRKDDDPLLKGEFGGQGRGRTQPEYEYAGIEGIDKKAAGKDLYHIPFAEAYHISICIFAKGHLFEKEVIDAHYDEKGAANIPYDGFVFQQFTHECGEGITDNNEHDITDPYSCYKAEPASMTIIKALFNNGKYYRPYRQSKDAPQH